METKDLEDIIDKEKINIVNYKMKPKARILDKHIFVDYSQIDTSAEEKCILAEELGHYYCDAYYTFNSSQIIVDKAEYRAKKWSYYVLIPFDNLRKAILNRDKYSLCPCRIF